MDKPGLRTVIVDDEPLARQKIREALEVDGDILIVAECANADEAIEVMLTKAPDLVFLDIQMPGRDGFEVLQAVYPQCIPGVVFVTAYDQFAIRAFDVHALDYVLKPFHPDRLRQATDRAKSYLRIHEPNKEMQTQIRALVEEIRATRPVRDRLVIKASGTVVFLKMAEIDWIASEENYVRIHAGKKSYLFRERLSVLEKQLDQTRFRRIHRSTIVNLDQIRSIRPHLYGDYKVVLLSGVELTLSRGHRGRLQDILAELSN